MVDNCGDTRRRARDFLLMVITTLDPETVIRDDAALFAERTSKLTDEQRATIADVLAAFAPSPWLRNSDKSLGQVERLVALWRNLLKSVGDRHRTFWTGHSASL
jgi:KaiC/GvpD/RAD55 family RecA-like ATPase